MDFKSIWLRQIYVCPTSNWITDFLQWGWTKNPIIEMKEQESDKSQNYRNDIDNNLKNT